ncbi:kinase-like domain-containing protein [Xylaria scruposa]|nr:kinase-like domain-containing protein [Xylaria scruposa]
METSDPHTSLPLPSGATLPPPPPFANTPPVPQLPEPYKHRRVLPDLYEDAQLVLPHEDLDKYTAGGFHPVNLGDTFQGGRYTIRHKLGHGGSSTAWLAYDREALHWVSIKVKSAAASTEDLDQDREISTLKQLERRYNELAQRGPMPFARLLDCFHHTGPNGTHNCLVTELLGPSVSNVLECYEYQERILRPDTVLRASCQLLDALAFFHRAGFAHGDVSLGNVAFTCEFDDEEDLFDAAGDPVTAEYTSDQIPWSPELPKHLVQATIWGGWYEPGEEDLRLIDMGETFPVGDIVTKIAQPMDVRSPETFFIGSFDYRHDLWRAGCVIYSLYFQKRPFESGWGKDAIFITRLVMKLGPLPDIWNARWEELKKQYKGYEEHKSRLSIQPLIEIFEPRRNEIISWCSNEDHKYAYEKDEFTEHDYAALESLLGVIEGLLQFHPDKRISLQEAVSHIRSKWTDYRRKPRVKEPILEEDV